MDFSELKVDAKKKLEGRWPETIRLILIFSLIAGFASGVGMMGGEDNYTFISSLLTLAITCVFGFGYYNYFLKVSRGEKAEWRELFSKTNLTVDFLVITIVTSILVSLWTLLFIIPGIIAGIKYSQVYLIKLDNPDMSALDTLKESAKIMEGHKMDYFLLNLSFIGWSLLGLLTCCILYFWLMPYISVTMCNFYNKIKKEKK